LDLSQPSLIALSWGQMDFYIHWHVTRHVEIVQLDLYTMRVSQNIHRMCHHRVQVQEVECRSSPDGKHAGWCDWHCEAACQMVISQSA